MDTTQSQIFLSGLLSLSVPSALNDDIADFLRAQTTLVTGFTSFSASGMGNHMPLTSTMEQVLGRSKRQVFFIEAGLPQLNALLQALGAQMQGADIHYWVTPVIQSGSLR